MTMETIRFGLELIIFVAIFVGIIYAGHKYASKKEVAEQTEREATRKAERLAEQAEREAIRKAEQAEREATRKAEQAAEREARRLENIEKQFTSIVNSLSSIKGKQLNQRHALNRAYILSFELTDNDSVVDCNDMPSEYFVA